MDHQAQAQADRILREARLCAVSLVLVAYGLVGWYVTRSLRLSVGAATPASVMSFSLLPDASPGSGLPEPRIASSPAPVPEHEYEPEPEPDQDQDQDQDQDHRSAHAPESIAESIPDPAPSVVQAGKSPVSPQASSASQQAIKTVPKHPRESRSPGPTTSSKPTHRPIGGEHSSNAENSPGAVAPASNVAAGDTVVVSQLDYDGPPPRPVYPQHALRARQQGLVMIRVLIGKDGSVLRADVSQSSGFELLDAAAVSATLRTKFRPYSRNGIAISASADLPFNFVVKP